MEEEKYVFALMKSSTDDCLVERDKIQKLFRSIELQMKENTKKRRHTTHYLDECDAEPVAHRPHQ